MSKFNRQTGAPRPAARGPIRVTSKTPNTRTYEGAPAFTRDAKGELFMLAVANMVGEDTFYESAKDRDNRFIRLVRNVAVSDPEWLVMMIQWLRSSANMRSASIVAAAEMVHERTANNLPGFSRLAVDAALQRADEPSELLSYWLTHFASDRQERKDAGLSLPKPLARGIADAVFRLYTEYGTLKYDTSERAVRFGDVIDLVKPTSYLKGVRGEWRGDLYGHLLDRRHGRDKEIPASLDMIRMRKELFSLTQEERALLLTGDDKSQEILRQAGMTWENLASWLGRKISAHEWAAILPSMGYMAVLRNLRNLDEAGLSDETADKVAARLADPEQVAKSRQFPYRFLSAYMAVSSDRWREPLRRALQHSVSNVPALPGRTLVLVDTSGSMTAMVSDRSTVSRMMVGALFGVALAAKGEQVDLYGFANGIRPFAHPVRKGASVLRETEKFVNRCGEDGHGTAIARSVQKAYAGHDRVVIISDMQTFGRDYYGTGNVSEAVPQDISIYGINTAGYAATVIAGQKRHELGGLTDATFRMIPLLERGEDAPWPWEM